jgi:hypothetical protein
MKTMLFLAFAAIFAMLPLGATAHGLRLRRIRPVIDVTLGSVREIVDPFGSFMKKRNRQDEDKKIIDEQEVNYSCRDLYELFTTMTIFLTRCICPTVISG